MGATIKNTIRITYTITFNSPFHPGTGLRRGLIDRAIARDAYGYVYIPGSTIKGVLRENCERLAVTPLFRADSLSLIQSPHTEHLRPFAKTPTLVERIFGSRFREGTVYFDDAIMSENPKNALGKEFFRGRGSGPENSTKSNIEQRFKSWQVAVRTQNMISRQTGTAVENALFKSEYGLQDLEFSGKIYGAIEGAEIRDTRLSDALVLFVAGFRFFDKIGGNKSVGMGRFAFNIPDSKIQVDDIEKTFEEVIESLQAPLSSNSRYTHL